MHTGHLPDSHGADVYLPLPSDHHLSCPSGIRALGGCLVRQAARRLCPSQQVVSWCWRRYVLEEARPLPLTVTTVPTRFLAAFMLFGTLFWDR